MKAGIGLAAIASAIALMAPAAAHAGRDKDGMAGGTPIDLTSTRGHAGLPEDHISDHLIGLINRAQPNSRIHGHVYQVEADDPVLAALRNAQAPPRNVQVRIVFGNGGDSPDNAFDWVPLDRRTTCDDGCHNTTNDTAKAHSKYFLFDATQQRLDDNSLGPVGTAVWIGSANLNNGSGRRASNFATTFFGNDVLWQGMWEVWTDGFFQRPPDGDYYSGESDWTPDNGVVFSSTAGTVAHISPDDNGPDMWAKQLAQQSSGSGCIVRMLMAQIADTNGPNGPEARAPVMELDRLARSPGGCTIRVVVGENGDGDSTAAVEEKSRDVLCALPGDVVVKKRRRVHDKALETYGIYEGHPTRRRQLWSGSHNWTDNALRDNDEVLLRVADSVDAYEQFSAHFYDVYYHPYAGTFCP